MIRYRRFFHIVFVVLLAALLPLTGCRSSKQPARGKDKTSFIGGLSFNPASLEGEEKRLVEEALTWLGTPYRYGGSDYSGTDCSGLTMKVYMNALGLSIPRSSAQQQKFCKSIKKGSLSTGDLLFFATGRDKGKVSHVGMYLGNGQFIHASASRGVIISHIEERYYTSNYHSSGHVARRSDKHRKSKPRKAPTPQPAPEPAPQGPTRLETEPLQFELDEVIESKIDSIYSSFLE